MNNKAGLKSRVKGFSLVEMAVVLVIIGIILGAVSIGKDVQRNAEYTKIKHSFLDQWVVTYNTYMQRTGYPVGDDLRRPRYMVNGATFKGSGSISGGKDMSGADVSALCEGGAPKELSGQSTSKLRETILKAGIQLPAGRAEGAEDRYVYLDANGVAQEIQVCFKWFKPGTVSGAGNTMVISGLTPDLARSLDQMYDGKIDAGTGMFRELGRTGTDVASVDWSQQIVAGDLAAGATVNDTAALKTMVAVLKMNQ